MLFRSASEEKKADYEKSYEKMMNRLENGDLDDLSIEIEVWLICCSRLANIKAGSILCWDIVCLLNG